MSDLVRQLRFAAVDETRTGMGELRWFAGRCADVIQGLEAEVARLKLEADAYAIADAMLSARKATP